jgi:ankyrin repeat protein
MSNVAFHDEIINKVHQLEKVIEILKYCPQWAKVKDDDGDLPLHVAMIYGGKSVFALVKVLVKLHPEGVKTKNKDGNLPIHILGWRTYGEASDESKRRAQEFLLKEYPEGSKIKNNEGKLPIHCAAERGSLSTAKRLLHLFPEGSKVADMYGCLPIHHACNYCRDTDDMVQLVVQLADAYPEGLQHKDTNGKLPVDIAVINENRAMIGSLALKEKERVVALIEDKKKYNEERKKYQDESFETGAASLKQQVDHAQKRMHLLGEMRKSEAILLSKLKNGDEWAIEDLKSILQSLNALLDAMKTELQPGSQPSMAQRLIPYLLNGANPSEVDLFGTIEAINSELSEMESKLARVSTTNDASISTATISLGASPENVSRKRARVSISPA